MNHAIAAAALPGESAVGCASGPTIEQLAHWSGASARTIKAWNQEGFLGPATRLPERGKRGRASYRFPVESIVAARRLQLWRRYVRQADRVPVWLWLEGFGHAGLDDDEMTRRQRNWYRSLISQMNREVPSLRLLHGGEGDEEAREHVFDELDAAFRQPLKSRLSPVATEAVVGSAALTLGVADADDVREWCRLAQEGGPTGKRLVGFIEASMRLITRLGGGKLPDGLSITEQEEQLFLSYAVPVLSLTRRQEQPIRWDRVRFAWFVIAEQTDRRLQCPDVDVADDPYEAFGAQWRRLAYRYEPEFTLMALAALADDILWESTGLPSDVHELQLPDGNYVIPDVAHLHSRLLGLPDIDQGGN